MTDGIPIEFFSRQKIEDQTFAEKLDMILSEIREGKILVLEESISPQERRKLMESSMQEVDDDFPGIEFSVLDDEGDIVDKVVNRVYSFLGRERRKGLTIVGNSEVMEKVKEDRESVSLLAREASGS